LAVMTVESTALEAFKVDGGGILSVILRHSLLHK
jgi:hypothetical protein